MRLLVVEDDAALRKGLVEGLAREGFAVDGVASAEAARARLAIDACDLVVLDLGLPGEDGLSFLRAMRARGGTLPVLVLTARGSVADHVTGLDAGADDYLRKPFAFVELVARIRALLRRGPLVADAVLRLGNLALDAGRHSVAAGATAITLTTKEFAVLEFLMRQSGLLVTRSMILEHCWDESYDGLSNLVDVHVGRLRRKLESAGASVVLRTLRGAGFVLEEGA